MKIERWRITRRNPLKLEFRILIRQAKQFSRSINGQHSLTLGRLICCPSSREFEKANFLCWNIFGSRLRHIEIDCHHPGTGE
jgi:hypothetical protein